MIRVNFTRIIIKLNDVLQECKVGGSKVDGCKIGGRKARFLAERTQHPQNSHIAENGVDFYIIYYNLYRGGGEIFELWQNSILSRCFAITSTSKYTTHYTFKYKVT